MDDLLRLVAELRGEVKRPRSIKRESEKETGWWSHTVPSPRQAYPPSTSQETVALLPPS